MVTDGLGEEALLWLDDASESAVGLKAPRWEEILSSRPVSM